MKRRSANYRDERVGAEVFALTLPYSGPCDWRGECQPLSTSTAAAIDEHGCALYDACWPNPAPCIAREPHRARRGLQQRGIVSRVSRRAACCAWMLATCLGRVPIASGVTPSEPAVYDAPPECPTRAQWMESLRARLPPLLRTHPLADAQRVHVERVAGPAGRGYEGFIDWAGAAESADARSAVRAATCAELIEVLSFMGALGLERIASDARIGTAAANSAAPAQLERSAAAGADGGAASTRREHGSTSSLGAVVFALLQTGMAPGWSLNFGAGGRLGWSAPGWDATVLLGFYSGQGSEVSVDGAATVRFEHWSTQAVGCPWRFPSDGPLGVRPCVDFELGMTSGEGVGVARAERHTAPWVSAGTQLRFELSLWERVELGALLGATKPLYRARFFIKPSSTAFETADFGFRTGTYASVLF